MTTRKKLAKSETFEIFYEYETVFLVTRDESEIVIGDFYGDPECALIDHDEKWCAIGGCGLIIYYLAEPFEPFKYQIQTDQWKEFGRNREDIWWIIEMEQTNKERIKFKVAPDDQHAGEYELNILSMKYSKL